MPMVRWFFGQRAAVLIVVVVVAITGGAIIYSWLFPAEESFTETKPDVVVPVAPPLPVPTKMTPPTEIVHQQNKPKFKITRKTPLPVARPKVWQVETSEAIFGYAQQNKLVWCPEEYIEQSKCAKPLDDVLTSGSNPRPTMRREDFEVDAFGITHVPTGASFVAYLAAQRFGFFRAGRLEKVSPNGTKYDSEQVLNTMKEMWRERMDSLDPNGPLNSR